MDRTTPDLGLYVHLPFCSSRCGYCDFAVVTDRDRQQAEYIRALLNEAAHWGGEVDRPMVSLYFGGGTPSRLAIPLWEDLFAGLRQAFECAPEVEITCESNPESLSSDLLACWAGLGINRISLGVQSFQPEYLGLLDRRHSVDDIYLAAEAIKESGITNWSLDLMYGLPNQTVREWEDDLNRALSLEPSHISFYNLILHPNLPVTKKALDCRSSDFEEVQAKMFLCGIDRLESAGHEVYELSNAALPGRECRHNRLYWLGGEWIGLGLSSASYYDSRHFKNPGNWDSFMELAGSANEERRLIQMNEDAGDRLLDLLMLRLRTAEGLCLSELDEMSEKTKSSRFMSLYSDLSDHGYLRSQVGALALSRSGWLLHSEITRRLYEELKPG